MIFRIFSYSFHFYPHSPTSMQNLSAMKRTMWDAPFHLGKLFKGVVSRLTDLTLPVVSYPQVQRIIIPNSPRNPFLFRMVHSPCSSSFPVRSVPPSAPLSLCESRLPKNSSSCANLFKSPFRSRRCRRCPW